MNKTQLLEIVKNLVATKNLTIKKEITTWKPFWYEIVWNTIVLSMPKWEDRRAFNRLIQDNESDTEAGLDSLSYKEALEMLFFHYPYWPSNWSNCVLINSSGDVLAINWNKMKNTETIKTNTIDNKWCIVINNKKQLNISLKIDELASIEPFLNSLTL